MSRRTLLRALLTMPTCTAALLVTAGCASTHHSATAKRAASITRPKITSSLDGRTVLPHHLRWLGYPGVPAAKVQEVDFLIDGKAYWVEKAAPYVYSGDDNGTHKGYLVTSFLRPGSHRFAVRATLRNGLTAIDSVTARVVPAPQVPPALAGTWQRTLGHAVAPDPSTDTLPNPAGTYTITFARQWIEDHYPGRFNSNNQICDGCIIDDDYAPNAHTFHVWGSV